MMLVVYLIRGDDRLALNLAGIILPLLWFKSSDAVRMWFEFKVASGHVVRVDNGLILVFSIVKIVVIAVGASIDWIAWVFLIEGTCMFCACLALYMKSTGVRKWEFDCRVSLAILRQSWPMALAVVAVAGYYRIDQVMIAGFLGNSSVGVYSVATQMSMSLYAIAMVICSTYFPGLIALRMDRNGAYTKRLKQLFSVLVYISLALAVFVYLASNLLVEVLYGDLYIEAGRVLAIHVWGGVFVFAGVLINRWQVAEGKQISVFIRTLAGLVANVVLNYLWIPPFGIEGAAYASLVSMAIVVLLLAFSSCRAEAFGLILGGIMLKGFGKHS